MASERVIGVYMIEHSATGRRYVGKSVNVRRRLAAHFEGRVRRGFLAAAIRKHGRAAFTTTILERCTTEDEATAREVHWIREMGSRAPDGFNLTDGGEGVTGHRWTEEARAAKSLATMGKVHSDETRAKMSAAHRARNATPEGAAKIAARTAKRSGYRHSEETRARIGNSNRGQRRDAATCAKIRAAKQITSDETRARMRAATLAMSDETRAKMRAARLAYVAKQREAAANG